MTSRPPDWHSSAFWKRQSRIHHNVRFPTCSFNLSFAVTKPLNPVFRFPGSRWKLPLAGAIAVAAAVHLLNTGYADWNAGADTAYVLGLLWLFFSRETIDDERVRELKLKSLWIAFYVGWAVTGVVRFSVYLQDRFTIPRTMSAYDVLFVMLLLAHASFHILRHRDGRIFAD